MENGSFEAIDFGFWMSKKFCFLAGRNVGVSVENGSFEAMFFVEILGFGKGEKKKNFVFWGVFFFSFQSKRVHLRPCLGSKIFSKKKMSFFGGWKC